MYGLIKKWKKCRIAPQKTCHQNFFVEILKQHLQQFQRQKTHSVREKFLQKYISSSELMITINNPVHSVYENLTMRVWDS